MSMGQRQDSLTDQMDSVYDFAKKHGCYDAADWIREHFYEQGDFAMRDWLLRTVGIASTTPHAKKIVERLVAEDLERRRRWEANPYGEMSAMTWPG